jgi:hypothetical protein
MIIDLRFTINLLQKYLWDSATRWYAIWDHCFTVKADSPRICLTPGKSCVKNLWRKKQGNNRRYKMAGTSFLSVLANRAQIPLLRFATTGITPWQSALKCRLLTVAIHDAIIFFVAIRSTIFFLYGNTRPKYRGVAWSAVYIWARFATTDSNPVPTILH